MSNLFLDLEKGKDNLINNKFALKLKTAVNKIRSKNDDYDNYIRAFDSIENSYQMEKLWTNKTLQNKLIGLNNRYSRLSVLKSLTNDIKFSALKLRNEAKYKNCSIEILASGIASILTATNLGQTSPITANNYIFNPPFLLQESLTRNEVKKSGSNHHIYTNASPDKNAGTINCHTEIHHIDGAAMTSCAIGQPFNVEHLQSKCIIRFKLDYSMTTFVWLNEADQRMESITSLYLMRRRGKYDRELGTIRKEHIEFDDTGGTSLSSSENDKVIECVYEPHYLGEDQFFVCALTGVSSTSENHSGGGAQIIANIKSIEIDTVPI